MSTSWRHPVETMCRLESLRLAARVQRLVARLNSPRQIASSLLVVAFVGLYLLAGITVFSRREPVEPARLQLWLSGGMVLYAIYHTIKYLWSARPTDAPTCVHTTPAMALWLAGGPLTRSTIVLHEAIRVIPATATKSMLLCVVLWTDVPNVLVLWLGFFLALFTLEGMRRVLSQVIDAMGRREKKVLQATSLLVGIAVVAQLGLQTINETPRGSDPAAYVNGAIAEVALFAGSDVVQWMALPLQPASHLAVSQPMWPLTSLVPAAGMAVQSALLFFASLVVIALLARLLISLDAWSSERRHAQEQQQLASFASPPSSRLASSPQTSLAKKARETPPRLHLPANPLAAIIARQLHCIGRYRINVLLSFAIPTVVSLSPLLTNTEGLVGHAAKQWIFVIGGIALSSLLLAPPALQIDFRRDLKRMGLLRSFPITASTMCAGMLSVPVLITILFQWITLGLATLIASPAAVQVAWLGLAFPALAVLTFAVENALFLAFPHHIHDQGIAMVIRAKLTFLWKGLVLALVPVSLFLWVSICHALLPTALVLPIAFMGSLLGCWLIALSAFAVLVGCWKRFDPAVDTPPD